MGARVTFTCKELSPPRCALLFEALKCIPIPVDATIKATSGISLPSASPALRRNRIKETATPISDPPTKLYAARSLSCPFCGRARCSPVFMQAVSSRCETDACQQPRFRVSGDRERIHGFRWDVLLALCAPSEAVADESLRFLYPAATHRLVQIRVRLEKLGLRRDVRELGVEQRLFGIGHLQIDRRPFPVTQIGQVAEAPQRLHVLRLLLAHLSEFDPIDQGILHILESADDRLFIRVERLSLHSFGLRDLTAEPPGVENRLQRTRRKRPGSGGAFEQIRELGTFQAEQRGEADVGKVCSLGHANVGVGGDEILLGLTDVGSALEQRCRQTVWHRGEEQGVDVSSPRNQGGMVTEQYADEVLLLRDLTLELGHPGHGLAVLRFSLLIVARGDGAFLETHPLQPRRFTQTLRGALRDFELPVQRPQLDIAAGDRSYHREDHRSLALLAGEQAGAGRLRRAA